MQRQPWASAGPQVVWSWQREVTPRRVSHWLESCQVLEAGGRVVVARPRGSFALRQGPPRITQHGQLAEAQCCRCPIGVRPQADGQAGCQGEEAPLIQRARATPARSGDGVASALRTNAEYV